MCLVFFLCRRRRGLCCIVWPEFCSSLTWVWETEINTQRERGHSFTLKYLPFPPFQLWYTAVGFQWLSVCKSTTSTRNRHSVLLAEVLFTSSQPHFETKPTYGDLRVVGGLGIGSWHNNKSWIVCFSVMSCDQGTYRKKIKVFVQLMSLNEEWRVDLQTPHHYLVIQSTQFCLRLSYLPTWVSTSS